MAWRRGDAGLEERLERLESRIVAELERRGEALEQERARVAALAEALDEERRRAAELADQVMHLIDQIGESRRLWHEARDALAARDAGNAT